MIKKTSTEEEKEEGWGSLGRRPPRQWIEKKKRNVKRWHQETAREKLNRRATKVEEKERRVFWQQITH